jgi:AcrR family transcriptional regulator
MTTGRSMPARSDRVSHNQVGQRLGRKGQETRERILAAMLRLLAEEDGPPVTLTNVAKAAGVRLTNLYLYFPDMGEMLLAALGRVMDTAEEAYLEKLRQRWPDETLYESCLAFVRAHYDFWKRNARILHMRNALADAGDLRVLKYRNTVSIPLIGLIMNQMDGHAERADGCDPPVATVLLTGLERVATVVTNPQIRIFADYRGDADQDAHNRRLIEAEAEVLALVIRHRRTLV